MKSSEKFRRSRSFSEELRRQIVGQIERKEFSISQICREYEVSRTAIYSWLYRYSTTLKKGTRMVMEKDS